MWKASSGLFISCHQHCTYPVRREKYQELIFLMSEHSKTKFCMFYTQHQTLKVINGRMRYFHKNEKTLKDKLYYDNLIMFHAFLHYHYTQFTFIFINQAQQQYGLISILRKVSMIIFKTVTIYSGKSVNHMLTFS